MTPPTRPVLTRSHVFLMSRSTRHQRYLQGNLPTKCSQTSLWSGAWSFNSLSPNVNPTSRPQRRPQDSALMKYRSGIILCMIIRHQCLSSEMKSACLESATRTLSLLLLLFLYNERLHFFSAARIHAGARPRSQR
jgi:hypothetical protein